MRQKIKRLEKKYKNTRGPIDIVKFLIICVVLAIAIILVCNMCINAYVFMQAKEWLERDHQELQSARDVEALSDQMFQNGLLNVGISIIGIAISIWAGLNIIQVIEKSQMAKVSKQVRQYEMERKGLYRKQFLGELKNNEKVISQYFYVLFLQLSDGYDDIPSNIYYRLLRLEVAYQKIYSKQVEAIRFFESNSICPFMEEVLEILELTKKEKLNKDVRQIVQEYVRSRRAEFYFNIGYDDKTSIEDAVSFFENSISEYMSLYSLDIFSELEKYPWVEVKDAKYYTKKLMENMHYISDGDINERYAIHILNTVAEAYSKIAYKYLRSSEKPKKMFGDDRNKKIEESLTIATKIYSGIFEIWKKDAKLGEFIFRNYGAALERRWRFEEGEDYGNLKYENFNTIKENYDESMQRALLLSNSEIKEGVFYAWGKLFYRGVKHIDLSALLPVHRGEVENLSGKDINYLKDWTIAACAYMRIAIHVFPRKSIYVIFYGIAMVYRAIFYLWDNNISKAEEVFEYATQILENAEMMKKHEEDDYIRYFRSIYNETRAHIIINGTPPCQIIKHKR